MSIKTKSAPAQPYTVGTAVTWRTVVRVDGSGKEVWARMTGVVENMWLDQAATGKTVWWATVQVMVNSDRPDPQAGMTLWASAAHFTPTGVTLAHPTYPTHRHAGEDSERASVGLPGHCEKCAEVGHVNAHPDLGCGDVRCNSSHDE